jgi:hypothetical protein
MIERILEWLAAEDAADDIPVCVIGPYAIVLN